MNTIDTMKQALEALESCIHDPRMRHTDSVHYEVVDAGRMLSKAITELESAEPVAWMIVTNNKNVPDRHDSWLTFDIAEFKHNSAPCLTIAEVTPLYSTQSDTRIEREMK